MMNTYPQGYGANMNPAYPGIPMLVRPPTISTPPYLLGQRPQVDIVEDKLRAAGIEQKLTNVWVGKICTLVEDSVIKNLLLACGAISNWQRVEANGQLRNFGFCKYTNAEGALRALRLLNGHRIGDDELHLKVDQATTQYLEEYEKKKNLFREKEKETDEPPISFLDTEVGDIAAKNAIEVITANVIKALNEDVEGSGVVVSKEVRAYREKQQKIEREKREREEEMERRRRKREDEEKRELRRQQEREEREFRIKEKSWLEHEKDRERSKKDYYESLKEKQIKRKQMILVDDEDEKPNRKKIRLRDSKKKRLREKEQDEVERAKEKHEADQLRREREKREYEEEKKREQEREREAKIKAETYVSSPSQQISTIEERKATPFSVSLNMTPMNAPKKTTAPTTAPSAIFTAVEDESHETNLKKKRKLMTLEHEVGNHEPKEVKQESNPILDVKAKAQQVIDKIPTERADLFKFEIDWSLVDEHNIVELKMKAWVKKKIIEYLGEEETTLIDYICKKLNEHTAPDTLLELLLLVLEDEASDFVIRMWRMLIYNILMIQKEQK
jgi:RNA-binding protein 25